MAFRFDKLTLKAQEAVSAAQGIAQSRGQEITALHLLQALLAQSDGIVRPLIEKIGAPLDQLNGMVQSELSKIPSVSGDAESTISRDLRQVLDKATQVASK